MTTYYISKGGVDSGPGTSWATAWLTATYAQSHSANDDTLWFGVGTWSENINTRRAFRGMGKFLTFLTGVTSSLNYIQTFTDITVGWASASSYPNVSNLTLTRARLDVTACANGMLWPGGTMNWSYSDIVGPMLAKPLYAFYYDAGNLTMYKCNLYRIEGIASLITPVSGLISMRNSVWYVNGNAQIGGTGLWSAEDHNCWYGSGGTISGFPVGLGTGDLKNINPLFQNPAAGDFRFAAGSPCINAGLA